MVDIPLLGYILSTKQTYALRAQTAGEGVKITLSNQMHQALFQHQQLPQRAAGIGLT